jgi:hypothetical protein
VDGYPGKISVFGLEINSDLGVVVIGILTNFFDWLVRVWQTRSVAKKY